MTITNTPNQITGLVLEQARSFALRLSFILADDTVVDLTGGTITFTMLQPVRKGTAVVLTKDATLVSPTAGYAVLDLQAAELDLDTGVYPYSITYIDADAYSATVVKGEVQIVSNTDPITTNVYDVLALDIELGFDNVVVTVNHLQAPTLTIGTVTTVPYNNPAGAGIRGGYPHQLLDLVIPKGAPGGSAEAYDEAFTAAVTAANTHSDAHADAGDAATLASAYANDDATLAAADDYTNGQLAAHAADTSTHGVGEVVGTTEAQSLSNKALIGAMVDLIKDLEGDPALAIRVLAGAVAVNYLEVRASASGALSPGLAAVGEGSSLNLNLIPKGIGQVMANGIPVLTDSNARTVTNKDLTSTTNKFPDRLCPIGTILEWPSLNLPSGYFFANGGSLSRTTYATLWDVLTYQFAASGAVASGQKVIPVASTANVKIGTVIDGPGMGANNTVASFVTNTSITMTNNITVASPSGTVYRLAPWGNGDGSTTFNLPNRMGNVAAGMDGTSEFYRLGQVYGERLHTLTLTELPAHTHSGNTGYVSSDHTHNVSGTNNFMRYTGAGGGNITVAFGGNNAAVGQSLSLSGITANHFHSFSTDNGTGGGGSHNVIQPTVTMNYIIRAA